MNVHVAAAIIEKVADWYSCTAEELLGRSRWQPVARARQVAMYLCREWQRATAPVRCQWCGSRTSDVGFADGSCNECAENPSRRVPSRRVGDG
jgi:hypothetical protein